MVTVLHPTNQGSTPAGTHESMVVARSRSGQYCSHVPAKVLPILTDMSKPSKKGVNYVNFGRSGNYWSVFYMWDAFFTSIEQYQCHSITVTYGNQFLNSEQKRIYLKERWKSYLCWGGGMIRSGFVRTLVDRFGGHILRQHFWRGRRQLFFSWLHSTLTQNKVQFWNSNFVLHNGNPSIHLLLKMVFCIQHYVALLLLYVWFVQLLKLWLTFWPISR